MHAGGILNSAYALDTEALADWGLAGRGQYMTLWVINIPDVINHCFLEFNMPTHGQQFSMAAENGTICGWFPYMMTSGYTARRRA